jgi:oligoribonuclease
MAYTQKFGKQFAWLNLQTTGVDPEKDFILEVAMVVTDFDLDPVAGYEEVVKLTRPAVDRIKENEYVLKMHKFNNLLKESAESVLTLREIELDLINTLKNDTTFDPGELILAGSGVEHFTRKFVNLHMPDLAKWFSFYSADIGDLRRLTKIFMHGDDVVKPRSIVKREGVQVIRAREAVDAQIDDAREHRDLFQEKLG